jgi:hypothetical protein
MKNIEMHCHSTLSDGRNTPDEVIAEAKRWDLDFLTLTDHDTIAPQEFQQKLREAWIDTCDSVEISARNSELDKSLHLVSYAKVFGDSLCEVLENSRTGKMKMKWGQFDKLISEYWFVGEREEFNDFIRWQGREPNTSNKYDMSHYLMSFSENKEKAKHILWDLCSSNDVVKLFYLEYLKREGTLYDRYGYEVEEYEPSVEQTIEEVVLKAWGLVSVAHPNVTFDGKKWWIPEFTRTIGNYVQKWVRGVEINSIASYEWVQAILEVQKQYDLILTFWSDCHDIWKTDEKHSTIGRINPFVETEIYEENFWNFRKSIGL